MGFVLWLDEHGQRGFLKKKCRFCALKLLILVNVFAADDMNWNALEWDRAAEELTWERVTSSARRCRISNTPNVGTLKGLPSFQMLGLDGSLVFLVNFLLTAILHPMRAAFVLSRCFVL